MKHLLLMLAVASAALATLSQPAAAGRIDVCNTGTGKIRIATVKREGFATFTDNWSVSGWYEIASGACQLMGGVSWGGTRSWGFMAIEREMSAVEMEYQSERAKKGHEAMHLALKQAEILRIDISKQKALRDFSFYDHMIKHLPGSRQNGVEGKFNAEADVVRKRPIPAMTSADVVGWDLLSMKERQDVIGDEGYTGTTYATCLPPRGGFNYTESGQPTNSTSCRDDQRHVPFTIDFWVLPASSMVINVSDEDIERVLRR